MSAGQQERRRSALPQWLFKHRASPILKHRARSLRPCRFPSAMSANQLPLPPLGLNPSTTAQGTTPGSFATRPVIEPGVAGARTFASPDTPGMPPVSEKTAWDFLPVGWATEEIVVASVNGA